MRANYVYLRAAMKLLEYQAKTLLQNIGTQVPQSVLILGNGHFPESIQSLPEPLVIKAQVPVNERHQAGGILFAANLEQAKQLALDLLARKVGGYRVDAVLIEEQIKTAREYFVAFAYDESDRRPLLLLSAAGGSGVEKRAGEVARRTFSALHGLSQYQAREMCLALGVHGRKLVELGQLLARLARFFLDLDMVLLEINPLAETGNNQFLALDCRIELDDDALYRHPDLAASLGGSFQKNPARNEFERRAAETDANDHRGVAGRLIAFDGDLGLLIGGGGASLTIFDAVLNGGGEPANYCEMGGNPSVWKVKELTKLILSQPRVRHLAVIMNVASNTRADLIARGVIKGVLELGEKPEERIIAFRVPGSWQAESLKILARYGVRYFDNRTSLDQVIEYVLAATKGAHGNSG